MICIRRFERDEVERGKGGRRILLCSVLLFSLISGVGFGVLVLRFGVAGVGVLVTDLLLVFAADLVFYVCLFSTVVRC
jgi:hypothetical protein